MWRNRSWSRRHTPSVRRCLGENATSTARHWRPFTRWQARSMQHRNEFLRAHLRISAQWSWCVATNQNRLSSSP